MIKYVLIDDDKLIHLSWKYKASISKIMIRCFYSVNEFLDSSHEIPFEVTIFIDSHLQSNIKGELESKKIYEMGYKSIFLSTGYLDFDISPYPWIKGITSKKIPF